MTGFGTRAVGFATANYLAVLLAVLALAVTFGLAYSRTSLTFAIRSEVVLLDANERTLAGGLTASFQGRPVTQLRGYEIALHNSGTSPIPARDFERRLRITSRSGSQFVSVQPVSKPDATDLVFAGEGTDTLEIAPVLLNPGDRVVFTIVSTTKEPADLQVTGRIAGIKEIEVLPDEKSRSIFGLTSRVSSVLEVLIMGGALVVLAVGESALQSLVSLFRPTKYPQIDTPVFVQYWLLWLAGLAFPLLLLVRSSSNGAPSRDEIGWLAVLITDVTALAFLFIGGATIAARKRRWAEMSTQAAAEAPTQTPADAKSRTS